jgi:GAF domain-containing protein
MEGIAGGAGTPAALLSIVRMIEAHADGAMCSVMRLDDDTGRIVHLVGPALPAAYQAALSIGAKIGPRAGACGTAAFLGEPIVSEDIETDPLWDEYRALARDEGLAACWSAPVVSARDGRVLGTFSMYFREPRQPGSLDWELLRLATRLAALAMERRAT